MFFLLLCLVLASDALKQNSNADARHFTYAARISQHGARRRGRNAGARRRNYGSETSIHISQNNFNVRVVA
jgi:hypothetical protein